MTEQANGESKRTRSMGEIVVEVRHSQQPDLWRACEGAPETFETTAKAEEWVRDNGDQGQTYRVIRVVRVATVKVETVRKATLF